MLRLAASSVLIDSGAMPLQRVRRQIPATSQKSDFFATFCYYVWKKHWDCLSWPGVEEWCFGFGFDHRPHLLVYMIHYSDGEPQDGVSRPQAHVEESKTQLE
jgi:hypothetical protein